MTTHPLTPAPAVSKWWILFLVHVSVLAFAINLQIVPPLLPIFLSELGLTHTQAGMLMGLFTLPGIFLALPGGRVADAIGPRSVALWALTLLGTGTLLMLPLHPGFLYTGRLCAGIGGAVIVVVAPQIIAMNFDGRELGLAMGIYNTAVPIGTILAFNVLGFLAGRFGIPVVIMVTALFTLITMAAFYLTYADPAPARQEPPPSARATVKGLGGSIWLVSLVWVLFNISILAYFTYSIDYFTGRGMAGSPARFLGSLPMLLSVFFTPLVGLAMHRWGLRRSLLVAGCALSSAAILLIFVLSPRLALSLSLLLGIGISMVPPAVFTIAGEVVPPSLVGTGYGLLTTIFNLGVFFGIPFVGHLRDITADYRVSFMVMAALMLMGAALPLISRRVLSK